MSRRRLLLANSHVESGGGFPANNEIWYSSSKDKIVAPYRTNVFGANIVSNTYENGKGVISFDGEITTIGDYAFSDCINLDGITIPNSVTTIGEEAFYFCTSLTSVTIPDSVTEIWMSAFADCTSLTSVIIGNGVTWIGAGTFYGCNSLIEVYIYAVNPPSLSYYIFYDWNPELKIYVPTESVNAYKEQWSEVADIIFAM